jgi:hypothetical protein
MEEMERCRDDSRPDSCAQKFADSSGDERERELDSYMTALTQLTRALRPIPDAKAIVLFSDGFSRVPSSEATNAARATLGFDVAMRLHFPRRLRSEESYDVLAAAASKAKVSFFTIRPAGASNTSMSARMHAPMSDRTNQEQIDVFRRSEMDYQEGLAEIARRTGGLSTQGSDALEGLRKMIDVSSGLYTVGYYLSGDTPASGHKLEILVRRKGVRIHMTRDVPDTVEPPSMKGQLSIKADPCSERGRRIAVLTLRVDRSALLFEEVERHTFAGNFSLFVRLFVDGSPEPLYREYRFLNVTNTKDEIAAGNLPDPTVEQTLLVPCKPITAVVTVADSQSGARGEFTTRLEP